jgi:sugar lactone lactonase YvrE
MIEAGREPRVVLDDIVLGESPRWHDGRVWFCDWGAGEVIVVDPSGRREVVTRMPGLPFCIDWLPDGRLLVVAGRDGKLLRLDDDLVTHADLSAVGGPFPWNDIAVDSRGYAYVNNIGYAFPGGEPADGLIAVVTPDGRVRPVAGGGRLFAVDVEIGAPTR